MFWRKIHKWRAAHRPSHDENQFCYTWMFWDHPLQHVAILRSSLTTCCYFEIISYHMLFWDHPLPHAVILRPSLTTFFADDTEEITELHMFHSTRAGSGRTLHRRPRPHYHQGQTVVQAYMHMYACTSTHTQRACFICCSVAAIAQVENSEFSVVHMIILKLQQFLSHQEPELRATTNLNR